MFLEAYKWNNYNSPSNCMNKCRPFILKKFQELRLRVKQTMNNMDLGNGRFSRIRNNV